MSASLKALLPAKLHKEFVTICGSLLCSTGVFALLSHLVTILRDVSFSHIFRAVLVIFWTILGLFWPLGAPWDALGDPWGPTSAQGPLPEWILKRFWLPFGVPVGTLLVPISVSFFECFSGTLLERLRGVLGGIWEFFVVHFGFILDAFWETL